MAMRDIPNAAATMKKEDLPTTAITVDSTTILPQDSELDMGHRYGNFHNYYKFHPPLNRLQILEETGLLDHVAQKWLSSDPEKYRKRRKCSSSDGEEASKTQRSSRHYRYGDVGCNEGDLTINVARALHKRLGDYHQVDFVGMDIDSTLINRANEKWYKTKNEESDNITGNFCVANVCEESAMDKAFPQSLDLLSILSTTMWIHIHAGDDGLKRVLRKACQKTRQFLLIEPQPSKCYRNAMVRLRKAGRPELDVSSERLKLRPNIEAEIEAVLRDNGFCKVETGQKSKRTNWNRALQLYERVDEEKDHKTYAGTSIL